MRVRNASKFSGRGLRPEILAAEPTVFELLREAGVSVVYRTAGTNGSHSRNSLHYVGLAIDYWWNGVRSSEKLCDQIAFDLGTDYDVVWEKSHLHIEFQPEGALNYVVADDTN